MWIWLRGLHLPQVYPSFLEYGVESSQQHTGDSSVRPDTPDTVVSHEANYTLEGINLTITGYFAYPVEHDDALPGLLLIHDSSGLDDMEMYRSEEVRDYFVFAADLSGGEDILTEVFWIKHSTCFVRVEVCRS